MPDSTYVIGSFLGGEISQYAQGRLDKPDYRISLKTCLNSFPVEASAWTRRPGTRHGGHTRKGLAGRVIKFDFTQSAAVTPEFTDGFLRFRNGATLITGNDPQVVIAVSAANPAVVQTTSATTWVTGDTLVFPGKSTPLLEARQFTATKVDTTHFSLADALTGVTIDGATLGALVAGATVARVHELATSYVGGTWADVRAVQAETTDILLSPTVPPQALTVTTLPSTGINPVFAITAAVFNDGPYLDPFTNGVRATPSAKVGIIGLALDFPAWSATTAYAAGAFVTTGGVNYKSLLDQNVNNAPAGLAPWWIATSAGAAINDGRGFLGTDVGRLVRLFSEPAAWAVGTAYAASTAATPVVVSYNPTGLPGATLYYQAAQASTGKIPGSDLTNWTLIPQGAAIWSWGKITSLTNVIDRALAGSANLGDMTGGGGLAAAFDGVFSQVATAAAERTTSGGAQGAGTVDLISSYVGKNYSGASDQTIKQAVVYPSSDQGLGFGTYVTSHNFITPFATSITLNLRGKATLPASASDGTLLATSGTIGNTTSPVTLVSTDQTTAWKYVWVEQITTGTIGSYDAPSQSYALTNAIGEVSFFSPTGTGTSAGVNVQILGAPLLYTSPISTWRFGVYSDTTGYPTCGLYDDGRIYMGGSVNNRFDACVSNGISGGTLNFAPTDQYGVVSDASAIAYTFNSKSVNKIVWMKPDEKGILMGTHEGEWLVRAPSTGPISPKNISARRVTKHGSANIEPCETEHTTIFIQRFAKKLLEYFPDVFSGKFSAPNLADKAQHIARAGVAELAYTSAVTPLIWGRDALGALFGITYKRDSLASSQPPTFYGWHRHTLGSGRTVESICAGPSVGGDLDALTMVTNDAATGIRHVEILTDTPDEISTLASAWFLDDAVTPTSTTLSATGLTLNGLWHLNGKTVQVFAGGLDCGDPGEGKPFSDFLVTNGSCFVPFGDSISAGPGRGLFTAAFVATNPPIVVGFTYNSDGQVLRPMTPADSGARNGPAFAKLSRGHRIGMKVVNTLGLSIGGDMTKKMYPAKFTTAGNKPIPALTSYSGIIQDTLQDDYGYEGGAPAWRVSRPWPATIVIVGDNLATQDQ